MCAEQLKKEVSIEDLISAIKRIKPTKEEYFYLNRELDKIIAERNRKA